MGKSHKAQHWIPKSYLAAWCDPDTPTGMEPYVWTFPRAGGAGKRKAPANIFAENDMYTIHLPGGGRDLRIEHGLSQLEKGLNQLRAEFIDRRRRLPLPRFLKFVGFIAAMQGRTKAFRDHQREQWARIADTGDELMRSMAAKTAEERKRIASFPSLGDPKRSMTIDQVRSLSQMPVQILMPRMLETVMPIMTQMVMTIYCTNASPGFITSDNPVIWFDPEAHKKPPIFRSPGLLDRNLEITMPLSPRYLVAIHHDEPISPGVKPIRYENAWPETVRAMNIRTLLYATETVVVSQDYFDPQWAQLVTQSDE